MSTNRRQSFLCCCITCMKQAAETDLKLMRSTDSFRRKMTRFCLSLCLDKREHADLICFVLLPRSTSRGRDTNTFLLLLSPVDTTQTVVNTVGCLSTRHSRLSYRLYNRFDNRLYRVNGVLLLSPVYRIQPVVKPVVKPSDNRLYRVYKHSTGSGCHTGCTTGMTTGTG